MNAGRLGIARDPIEDLVEIEREIEADYQPSVQLAIYGTLAPGKVNHHHIADLGGTWQPAAVRGRLGRVPAGEHKGLPAIVLDPAALPHPLQLLCCEALPISWARLDAFEGPEMRRLLVPLESEGRLTGVANIYALRGVMIDLLR